MKCPLLTDKNYGEQLERTILKGDCITDECAWWDEKHGHCAILTIASLRISGLVNTRPA